MQLIAVEGDGTPDFSRVALPSGFNDQRAFETGRQMRRRLERQNRQQHQPQAPKPKKGF